MLEGVGLRFAEIVYSLARVIALLMLDLLFARPGHRILAAGFAGCSLLVLGLASLRFHRATFPLPRSVRHGSMLPERTRLRRRDADSGTGNTLSAKPNPAVPNAIQSRSTVTTLCAWARGPGPSCSRLFAW